MSLTICIVATKGGVDKTTLTANVGAFLATLLETLKALTLELLPHFKDTIAKPVSARSKGS